LTTECYAKNLLTDKICDTCSWKIDVCFSSSKDVWCHRMKKSPKENTCEYFSEVPEIMRHLRDYVMQKHI